VVLQLLHQNVHDQQQFSYSPQDLPNTQPVLEGLILMVDYFILLLVHLFKFLTGALLSEEEVGSDTEYEPSASSESQDDEESDSPVVSDDVTKVINH
jgi:hypothetical protein